MKKQVHPTLYRNILNPNFVGFNNIFKSKNINSLVFYQDFEIKKDIIPFLKDFNIYVIDSNIVRTFNLFILNILYYSLEDEDSLDDTFLILNNVKYTILINLINLGFFNKLTYSIIAKKNNQEIKYLKKIKKIKNPIYKVNKKLKKVKFFFKLFKISKKYYKTYVYKKTKRLRKKINKLKIKFKKALKLELKHKKINKEIYIHSYLRILGNKYLIILRDKIYNLFRIYFSLKDFFRFFNEDFIRFSVNYFNKLLFLYMFKHLVFFISKTEFTYKYFTKLIRNLKKKKEDLKKIEKDNKLKKKNK